MKQNIKESVQSCTCCIITRNVERTTRPLSTPLCGERPKEVVHAYFLYMEPAENEDIKIFLVIKDDLSSYTWIFPCERADSDAVTAALGKWIACFGEISCLVTDQALHFKISLLRKLTYSLHIKHHFTTAYCPRANDLVERVCKEDLRIARAYLSE